MGAIGLPIVVSENQILLPQEKFQKTFLEILEMIYPYLLITYRAGSPCKLLKDEVYTEKGGYELVKPNPPTNKVCAKICKKRKENNPNINGMMWTANIKRCLCVIGMEGRWMQTGYDICYFGTSFDSFQDQVHMIRQVGSQLTFIQKPRRMKYYRIRQGKS